MIPKEVGGGPVASLHALTMATYQSDKGCIQINAQYPGIWVSGKMGEGDRPYQSATIAAYIDSNGNPCFGLYGKRSKMDACDLAFTVDADNVPSIQFRKADGSIGFIGLEKLAEAVDALTKKS